MIFTLGGQWWVLVMLILFLLQANTVYGALRALEVMYDLWFIIRVGTCIYMHVQGCDCIDPYGSFLISSYVSIIFQTFSQLCSFDYGTKSVQIYKAPWCIRDKPRFAFRGLLLGMLHLVFVRKSKLWKFVYNFVLECIFSRFHRFVEFQIVNG